jgi:IS5 family transposase
MYKRKDRKTLPLFSELFPFGGKLDENNRWLRISALLPWEELEDEYGRYFSALGRPAKDAQLVIGLLLLKHMTGLSDADVVLAVRENPYMQAFCGFEHFVTSDILDSSSLTRVRKRLGVKFFRQLEEKTYRVLIERKIIKAKGMLVDATVFPEHIKYPHDVGLLNDVRGWLVDNIKKWGTAVGRTYRTYCRLARREYLNFSKKKNKTRKVINKAKKQMLQYVRRNLNQFKEVIEELKAKGYEVKQKILERLRVVEEIYRQQLEMYKQGVNRMKERIVSFHRPYVRPIKRGKLAQKVEFGGKGALAQVDGFLFLDYFQHKAFSEAEITEQHLLAYEERFGTLPPYFTADRKYGTRDNRRLLEEYGVRPCFKPLGRRAKLEHKDERWFKRKQKERNRIEGSFGNGKQHYGLDRVRYSITNGSEIWIRAGILAMNLKTAAKRA